MRWVKKGQIFKPDGSFQWSHSYAQIPRPLILEDRIRIYYATRCFDDQNLPLSQTSFIDVNKNNLCEILYVHKQPSLQLGEIGSFSHYGIHPTMLINNKNNILFYYQGWNRCVSVPYETSVGLAISKDNGFSFVKNGKLPVFGKSEEDPYFVNGVFILNENSQFNMWYSSCIEWLEKNGKNESVYVIKRAISTDLLNWKRETIGCIKTKLETECQNSATVVKIKNKYHMWFCYRHALDFRNQNRGYRIGYAWSENLKEWHRDDSLAGIDVSIGNDWDSQMICYPYVFDNNGKLIMLYCGNYFGKDGFGYAELEI